MRFNSLKSTFLLFLLIFTPLLYSCAGRKQLASDLCDRSNYACINHVVHVSILTTKGVFEVAVDGINSPLTAGNFVDLVSRGIYNGTVFHRVVKSPVPFVVQGGDPATSDPSLPTSAYGTGHFIDPKTGEARLIPLEFRVEPSKKLLYGVEISSSDRSQRPLLLHERGALAMARSASPNSASSQFYIALEALPELDGRYAVFGRVVKGMDVVDSLQQGDKLLKAQILN